MVIFLLKNAAGHKDGELSPAIWPEGTWELRALQLLQALLRDSQALLGFGMLALQPGQVCLYLQT